MNEDGINKLTKEISRGQIDLFHSQLVKIKEGLLTEFDDLQEHDKRKAELTSKEKEILDLCTTQLSGEIGWKEIVEQEFYVHWIDYIENEYPELKGHSFDTYVHNRDQLSKLVKEHREVVVQKIASQINSSIIRPDITSGLSHAYKQHDDQWSALLDELNKKKHILPVRKLIEQYEPIILKIAPCWLATPSAVSSIFPLKKNMFDLIIFDEASQSPVADSLTSLYRGKKVVVIGDEKQSRPSDLFELKEDEYKVDEDIDRTLLSESLLTLASRAFSYNYLKWHYRSAFQELIDFSNHAFYEGRLKIAPNILRGATPIRWIACNDGVWLDRKNIPEAIRVVDEVKEYIHNE